MMLLAKLQVDFSVSYVQTHVIEKWKNIVRVEGSKWEWVKRILGMWGWEECLSNLSVYKGLSFYSSHVPPQSLSNSQLFLYVFIHTCMHTHKYACIECTYIYMCTLMHKYTYVCVYKHSLLIPFDGIYVCVWNSSLNRAPLHEWKALLPEVCCHFILANVWFPSAIFSSLLWTTVCCVCFGAILFCASWMISVWGFQKHIFEACFVQHRILEW